MNYCDKEKFCGFHNTQILETQTSYDKCKIEIRRCKLCNGFWKIKYRDKGDIYLRIEECNLDFPAEYFIVNEVRKYGFEAQCGEILKYINKKGLSCDPINLETIEVIEHSASGGYERKVEIKKCKKCDQYWKMYSEYDSHHGGYSIYIKPGEDFNYNGGGSFSLEEYEKYKVS